MWCRSHCIHFRDRRGFKSIMAGSAHGIGDTDLDCPPRQTNTARTADAWFSSSSHPYSTAISRCWVLGGQGDRWFSWDGSSTSSFISVGCDTFSTYWSWGSWPRGNQWAQCFCRARLDFNCHMVSIWSCEWLPKMASKKVHPAVSWCIYGLIPWRSCWMGRKLQRSILHSNKNVEILHYFWSPSRQGARFSGVSRQSLTSLKEKRSHDWKKRNKPIGFKDFRHQLSIKKVLAPWFFRISSSTFVWSWAFNTNRKHQDNNARPGVEHQSIEAKAHHELQLLAWDAPFGESLSIEEIRRSPPGMYKRLKPCN